MNSEWMKVMLDEIARKQAQTVEERLELERRRGDLAHDGAAREDGTNDVAREEGTREDATRDVARGDGTRDGARGDGTRDVARGDKTSARASG